MKHVAWSVALFVSAVLLAAGCAASHQTRPAATPVVEVPAAVVVVPEKCEEDELARRVTAATATLAEGTSGKVDVWGPNTALECMLRARHLTVRPRDSLNWRSFQERPEKDVDVIVDLSVDARSAGHRLFPGSSKPLVLAWTDESRYPSTVKELNFVAPIGTAAPGKWGHVIVAPGANDARRGELGRGLAKSGLFPWASGIEILEVHDDGSADVRVLGYPALDYDDSTSSWSSEHLWMASRRKEYEWLKLVLTHSVLPEMRAIAGRTAREIGADHRVFGPPHSNRNADLVKQSMHVAVGTCDEEWILPTAVVLRGRLHLENSAPRLDVERVEQTLALATWTALEPRYTKAINDAKKYVDGKGSSGALTAITNFHRDLRRAYGTASNLLELDVVLNRLEEGFEHGSTSEAAAGLEETRCELFDAERELHDALSKDQ